MVTPENAFPGLTPEQFLETAREVVEKFGPRVRLHKNAVGNLAVLDEDGTYIGWVDLRYGGATDVREELDEPGAGS